MNLFTCKSKGKRQNHQKNQDPLSIQSNKLSMNGIKIIYSTIFLLKKKIYVSAKKKRQIRIHELMGVCRYLKFEEKRSGSSSATQNLHKFEGANVKY